MAPRVSRRFLASLQDAVKSGRGGGVILGFPLAVLVAPQAHVFRASGSGNDDVQSCGEAKALAKVPEARRMFLKEAKAECT